MTSDIEKPAIPAGLPAGHMFQPQVDARLVRRSVEEWRGATPDSAIPAHVKRRILDRYGWKCYLTQANLRDRTDFDFDHVIAIVNGGENREFNIAPVLRSVHREKTKQDIAERAAVDHMIISHYGLKNKRPIPQRPKQPKPKRDQLPLPPRLTIYVDIDQDERS